MSRKPNRTPSANQVTPNEAAQQGLSTATDPRDPNKEVKRKRISMEQGGNLDLLMDLDRDNYYYRWFSEQPSRGGRIQRAEAAFYEKVCDKSGQPITRPSGEGTMYLMRLPIEYWEEDQQAKREKVERTLRDEARVKGNQYAPTRTSPEGGDSAFVDRKETDNPYA